MRERPPRYSISAAPVTIGAAGVPAMGSLVFLPSGTRTTRVMPECEAVGGRNGRLPPRISRATLVRIAPNMEPPERHEVGAGEKGRVLHLRVASVAGSGF